MEDLAQTNADNNSDNNNNDAGSSNSSLIYRSLYIMVITIVLISKIVLEI